MPSYDFECGKCGEQFTAQQTFRQHDQHRKPKCPKCGSKTAQQLIAASHVKTSKKS